MERGVRKIMPGVLDTIRTPTLVLFGLLLSCKVKMQVGQFTLINQIVYLLLKIATIFLNYVVISEPRKMIFVKNLKLIIKILNIF